jgi:hypothetical protein
MRLAIVALLLALAVQIACFAVLLDNTGPLAQIHDIEDGTSPPNPIASKRSEQLEWSRVG